MTSHVARLYALAVSLLVFFLAWAGIAAHPWRSSASSQAAPTQALAAYQQRLKADAALLGRLSARQSSRASTPAVKVVTLPPVTTTRTS